MSVVFLGLLAVLALLAVLSIVGVVLLVLWLVCRSSDVPQAPASAEPAPEP